MGRLLCGINPIVLAHWVPHFIAGTPDSRWNPTGQRCAATTLQKMMMREEGKRAIPSAPYAPPVCTVRGAPAAFRIPLADLPADLSHR